MQLEEFLKTKTQVKDRVIIYDGWTEIMITIDHEDLFLRCLSPTYR